MKESPNAVAWLPALGLLGFLVYSAGIDILHFGDDFSFYPDSSCSSIINELLHKRSRTSFFRPVDTVFQTCVQAKFDLGTIPVHIATIFLHALLSYLVLITLLTIGCSRIEAILGSLFMLISQANAFAILSNDTLSQVSGTFFGFLSVCLLHSAFSMSNVAAADQKAIHKSGVYGFSVFAFGLALLSKESSVSFFPLLIALIVLNLVRLRDRALIVRQAVLKSLPFLVLLSGYVIARGLLGLAGPTFGADRYGFRIGIHIARNLLLLLIASFVPVSSVGAFAAVKGGEVATCATIAVGLLVLVGAIGYGLWRSHWRLEIVVVGSFGVCALFPMAMLNHVSELYAYNCMPFVSILAGMGLGKLWELGRMRSVRTTVAAGLLALGVSHIMAIQSKCALMEENGVRAKLLMEEILPYAQRVPVGGELWLVNPNDQGSEYSIFLMRAFNVLKYGEWVIKRNSNRSDITVKIIEASDVQLNQKRERVLFLCLEGDSVKSC